MESYLCDPIIVFSKLLDEGKAPRVDGITLGRGEEYRLRELSSHQVQAIADVILAPVSERLGGGDGRVFDVTFIGGQTVLYPIWLKDLRGHDIKAAFF